jgi:hypothetical protein
MGAVGSAVAFKRTGRSLPTMGGMNSHLPLASMMVILVLVADVARDPGGAR